MTEPDLDSVRKEFVRREFQRCTPWIQSALDQSLGEYEIGQVLDRLEEGDAQIWPKPNACAITNIEDYPSGLRVLRVWLAGGELSEIIASEATIASWAKAQGCKSIITSCRPGWGRAFKDLRPIYTTFAKDI